MSPPPASPPDTPDGAPDATAAPPALIAFDVDGTLFGSAGRPLASTMRAISAARDSGVTIALASGRDAFALRVIAQRIGLPLDGLMLFGRNGSQIVDAETEVELWSAPIPAELLHRVVDHAAAFPVSVSYPCGRQLYSAHPDGHMVRREAEANGQELIIVDSLKQVTAPVTKVLCGAEPPVLASVAAEIAEPFTEELTFLFSAPFYFEGTLLGIDKGTALHHYCELAGLDPARTVAFGDHENDIGMIRAAGLGVAMGNAIPAAKAAADLVTRDHDSDGIAAVLGERFGLR